MRRSYAGARKGIALLTIVGTIVGSHGNGSASSPQTSYSQLRVRSMTSMHAADNECKHSDSSQPSLDATSSTVSSVAATVAVCGARGGATDDDRRRGYDRGEPPPRRTSPPYDWDRDEMDRKRDGSRPSRGDSRGSDPRRGDGPRPQGGRDRRHMDDFDDRSSRNRDPRGDSRRDYYEDQDKRERGPRGYKPDNIEPDVHEGKSKKWFTLKKDKAKAKTEDDQQTEFNNPQSNIPPGGIPPPPPPPPPTDSTTFTSPGVDINPADTERTPIHYMFPTTEAAAEQRIMSDTKFDDEITMDDAPGIPFLDVDEDEYAGREGSMDRRRRRRMEDDGYERVRVSARRDVVTTFMATKRGAMKVRVGSMIVGAGLGAFIGKVSTLMAFILLS